MRLTSPKSLVSIVIQIFQLQCLQSKELDSCSLESDCSMNDKNPQSSMSDNALAVVPYDETHLSIFHKVNREFIFANKKFSIGQDWKALGVAAVVWDSAIVMCEYMVKNADLLANRTVIELGAGSGLVGLVASHLGGTVTVTERKVVLEYLQKTITNNTSPGNEISVRELDWTQGLSKFRTSDQTYDIILGADIIYIEDLFSDLLRTLQQLCWEKSQILLSCKIRYERDRTFLNMLADSFILTEVYYDKPRDIYIYQAVNR